MSFTPCLLWPHSLPCPSLLGSCFLLYREGGGWGHEEKRIPLATCALAHSAPCLLRLSPVSHACCCSTSLSPAVLPNLHFFALLCYVSVSIQTYGPPIINNFLYPTSPPAPILFLCSSYTKPLRRFICVHSVQVPSPALMSASQTWHPPPPPMYNRTPVKARRPFLWGHLLAFPVPSLGALEYCPVSANSLHAHNPFMDILSFHRETSHPVTSPSFHLPLLTGLWLLTMCPHG